jgi:hypothetical protein
MRLSKKQLEIFDTYIGMAKHPTSPEQFNECKEKLQEQLKHLEILESIVDTLKRNKIPHIPQVISVFNWFQRRDMSLEEYLEDAIKDEDTTDTKFFKQKIKERNIINDVLALWAVK